MKIQLNTSVLNTKILKPISRIVEDCILTVNKNQIESVAAVAGGGIIIYVKYNAITDIEEEVDLNIKDIGKLISVLNCIKGETINMDIEYNNIKYSSDDFKFKFHLMEDGVISKPKISRKNLENIDFQTSTSLNSKIFYDILKASSFIKSDDVKLYFYTKRSDDGQRGLYCELTNKNIINSDSISIKLCDNYDGEDLHTELKCDIEYIRKMNINKDSEIYLYFNTDRQYTFFDIVDEGGKVRYIIPNLSK